MLLLRHLFTSAHGHSSSVYVFPVDDGLLVSEALAYGNGSISRSKEFSRAKYELSRHLEWRGPGPTGSDPLSAINLGSFILPGGTMEHGAVPESFSDHLMAPLLQDLLQEQAKRKDGSKL